MPCYFLHKFINFCEMLKIKIMVKSSIIIVYKMRSEQREIQAERVIFLSGFTYKEQYAVVVICKDEKEQETVYNRLLGEGYKLKVVAV